MRREQRRHQPDVGARQRLADLQLQPRLPARQHERRRPRSRPAPTSVVRAPSQPDGAEAGFDDDHRGDGPQQHAGQLVARDSPGVSRMPIQPARDHGEHRQAGREPDHAALRPPARGRDAGGHGQRGAGDRRPARERRRQRAGDPGAAQRPPQRPRQPRHRAARAARAARSAAPRRSPSPSPSARSRRRRRARPRAASSSRVGPRRSRAAARQRRAAHARPAIAEQVGQQAGRPRRRLRREQPRDARARPGRSKGGSA